MALSACRVINGPRLGVLVVGKVLKSVAIAAAIIGVALLIPGGIGFAPVMAGGTSLTAAVAIGTTVTVGAVGSALVAMAVATVLSGVQAQFFGPKTTKAQASRLNPTLEPSASRKIVFGETAMNTDVRYFEPSGTNQEYMDYIIATSAHAVESIDEIWFEDRIAWSSATGVDAFYTGYLTIATVLEGTSANYISINGGVKWGSTRRLTGCSYIHIRLKRTGTTSKVDSPLVNGLPSRVTIRGKGAKIYDPRLDSTVTGGSGTQRANNQSTWGASQSGYRDNPALQLLWFLLGWKIGGKLSVGCGVPPSRIDLASFITAANICDEAITLAAGGTQPRYRTAGVASDSDARMEIIQIFLSAMNGTLRDSGGKLAVVCMKNDLASPVLEFSDDDIIGDFTWNQTRGLDESFNAIHGKYTDPSNNSLYQAVEYPVQSLTSVDGIERMQTFDVPFVQEGRRAQRIAKQVLQRAQYKGVFSATFNMKALGCQVGNCVWIDFEPLGWANKPFRILSQGISNSGLVPMTMIEENAAIYAWDASEFALVTPVAPTVYDPLNSPYILGIQDAEAIADGKITSFYQDNAPIAEGIGDIWIDTNDSNKLYRWNGSVWILSRDTGITSAISAAADAQATADGKIATFYSSTTPTAESIGDLWYNTSTGVLKRWDGSTWQDTATRNVSKGAWLTSTSYIVGDIVSYLGSSYTCILAHTSSGSNTPPNATYWTVLAEVGDPGDPGEPGATGVSTRTVFQRSATAPATPAASSTTPSGWYDTTTAVPAGSNPMWSTTGERPSGGTNYAWGAPIQVQAITSVSTGQFVNLSFTVSSTMSFSLAAGESRLVEGSMDLRTPTGPGTAYVQIEYRTSGGTWTASNGTVGNYDVGEPLYDEHSITVTNSGSTAQAYEVRGTIVRSNTNSGTQNASTSVLRI